MNMDNLKMELATWQAGKLSLFGWCLIVKTRVETQGLSWIICLASMLVTANKNTWGGSRI